MLRGEAAREDPVSPRIPTLPPIFAAIAVSLASGAALARKLYNDPYARVGRLYLDAAIGGFEPQSGNHLGNRDGEDVVMAF
jgi:hypothetical protein